jgi:hypothetical protein
VLKISVISGYFLSIKFGVEVKKEFHAEVDRRERKETASLFFLKSVVNPFFINKLKRQLK